MAQAHPWRRDGIHRKGKHLGGGNQGCGRSDMQRSCPLLNQLQQSKYMEMAGDKREPLSGKKIFENESFINTTD
jgi:hypothetical protein